MAAIEEAIAMNVNVIAVCLQSFNQEKQPLFNQICQQAFTKENFHRILRCSR